MPHKRTVIRWVLLAVNVASTVLTLFTGLRENPVVVFVSGRYDLIRSRLLEGRVNYKIVRDDLLDIDTLVNLTDVANNYRFFSAPKRSPDNLGEDRSTCVRVNSMNATVMTLNYDDFWGNGARRVQIFLYSISAPQCAIINFQPEWYGNCLQSHGSNASQCHRYILDNFDDLQTDRLVQVGIEQDFGEPGVPFLKCLGRPERSFRYVTDLMVHQSYWAGGSYHVEIQSSKCVAQPILRNSDMKYGLFQVEPADHAADVFVAVDNSGWVASIIVVAYGIVSIVMIASGVLAAVVQSSDVLYLPMGARFLKESRFLRYILPSMSVATVATDDENAIIRFKGSLIMASDVWINHWLYVILSMLEALVNLRMTYIVLEMGTWMLNKQVSLTNFIFMCSALTRITWIMCLLHSLLRLGTKLALRGLKTLKLVRVRARHNIEWYVDASALFLGYKMYSLLLCIILYVFLAVNGRTTFMRPQAFYKQGVYGGSPEIAQFWGNEIICDLTVILSILTLGGMLVGALMLATPYRHAVNNGFIRLLQQRYVLVGWDVFVVMEALGIDPFNPKLVDQGTAMTSCSVGSILQQLYQSGPSGRVQLAGDYLFHDNGFSKEPMRFSYPTRKALAMGLLQSKRASAVSTAKTGGSKHTAASHGGVAAEPKIAQFTKGGGDNQPNDSQVQTSIFDRRLRVFCEGNFGRLLLVDEREPGKYCKSEAGFMEYVVQDALSYANILDIKHLLGNDKKLRIS
ncbi:hypothetical protein Gpo141_00005870 [Globisporangium polare]